MVYKRKKTYRKKTYRKRRATTTKVTKIPRYVAATRQRNYPTNRIVTLSYSDRAVFNYGGVSSSNVIWIRANGIWDPDPALGGHSAMGQAEWANFFKEYTVVSSHIVARYLCNSGVNTPRVQGISLEDGETFPAILLVAGFQEQATCRWRIQQVISNGNTVTIRNKYNATKWHGINDIADADDQRVSINDDPAGKNAVYYRVASYIFDDSFPGAAQTYVSFRVTYNIMLNDQQVLRQSGVVGLDAAEADRRHNRFMRKVQEAGFKISDYDPEANSDDEEESEPESETEPETDIVTSDEE